MRYEDLWCKYRSAVCGTRELCGRSLVGRWIRRKQTGNSRTGAQQANPSRPPFPEKTRRRNDLNFAPRPSSRSFSLRAALAADNVIQKGCARLWEKIQVAYHAESCIPLKTTRLKKVVKRKYAGKVTELQQECVNKRRRSNFSDYATKTLRNWFSANKQNPYPSER